MYTANNNGGSCDAFLENAEIPKLRYRFEQRCGVRLFKFRVQGSVRNDVRLEM